VAALSADKLHVGLLTLTAEEYWQAEITDGWLQLQLDRDQLDDLIVEAIVLRGKMTKEDPSPSKN